MAETLATYSVPEHHVMLYTANVRQTLVRNGGLLAGLVTRGSYVGELVQVVNFIGQIEFIERTTPYSDTKLTELEHTSRWIVGREFDTAVLVDRLDTLKMIYDPTSPYVERMRQAAARKFDAIIMEKFFAIAKTGKTGTIDTPYNVANTVVHGGTGLTLAKLRALRKLMKKGQVDMRAVKPYIAVTAEEIDDLLGETQLTSSDYNSVKTLVDGEVNMFMGFIFVPYEDYGGEGIPSYVAAGPLFIRQCPAWIPDGMNFGMWQDLVVTINNRPDKNNIKQIHATFTAGATRVEEDMVYMVECVE
jgi:hypothetical protein